ncbi:MAG TPA: hypothetical protein GXX73_14210 [Clostridium sp.]|nr:hypothetical protein [Clostridium sp.]
MEAILFVAKWTTYLLVIVPPGAALMVTYHALTSILSDDESVKNDAKKKISNTIKASIIMESIVGLITVIKRFYV